MDEISLPRALVLLDQFKANEQGWKDEIERERHRRTGVEADIRNLRTALVTWRDTGDNYALLKIIPVDSWGLRDHSVDRVWGSES